MRHRIHEMTRRQWILALICCLLLLTAAFANYSGGHSEKNSKQQPLLPLVRVQQVEKKDMIRHIILSGQTVAGADVSLAPKYTGRVIEVCVELGDQVHAGDLLMRQDTGDLDLSILQNEAAAEAAAADAVEAEATYDANYIKVKNAYDLEQKKYERKQYLFSIGAISQDELDTEKQEYLTLKAAFEILENQGYNGKDAAAVRSKQLTAEKMMNGTKALCKQREDMFLYAPCDGIIGFRNVDAGEIITAGTQVFSLVDTSRMYVDCTIAESDAAILKAGDEPEVMVEALARKFHGKIIYVSPSMDTDSKTYTVRLLLDTEGENIKAGLFAKAQIDILQKQDTIAVPKEAVFQQNGKPVVFVLREDGTVEERKVQTGLTNDTEEEILERVSEGETLVLNNQDKLRTGMAVETSEAGT